VPGGTLHWMTYHCIKTISGGRDHPIMDISGAGWYPILNDVPRHKLISGGSGHPIIDISGARWAPYIG
jgi:hypothetical protein